jgi:hypothetical protein
MNCWREIAEGKRIAEGELLKLKREPGTVQVCTENFNIGFRKAKLKKS